MRNGVLIVATAFAVTLAVAVSNRLSNEAMAVIAGALCGISASIPVSVGLLIAASRNWGREQAERASYVSRGRDEASDPSQAAAAGSSRLQPPVILVSSPPAPYALRPDALYLPPSAPPSGAPREFRIIGEEE